MIYSIKHLSVDSVPLALKKQHEWLYCGANNFYYFVSFLTKIKENKVFILVLQYIMLICGCSKYFIISLGGNMIAHDRKF